MVASLLCAGTAAAAESNALLQKRVHEMDLCCDEYRRVSSSSLAAVNQCHHLDVLREELVHCAF